VSYSISQSRTFTISQARYVTSKIAADLELVRAYYGWPSVDEITHYEEEAAILLNERYLKSVEYGFKKNGKVVLALKYVATSDGTLQGDDKPGRVPYGLDLSDSSRYSYLEYSHSFHQLSSEERVKILTSLPVSRTDSPAPETVSGYWQQSRSYSNNGEGVVRNIFRPL
jgi:HORMA domain-containing protein